MAICFLTPVTADMLTCAMPVKGGPHSVIRLPDWNTLIACSDHNDQFGKAPRAFEVIRVKKVVWIFDDQSSPLSSRREGAEHRRCDGVSQDIRPILYTTLFHSYYLIENRIFNFPPLNFEFIDF